MLDEGDDGPGDKGVDGSGSSERTEEGREAGKTGSWIDGELGCEPESLSVVACSGVGDGVGNA
jgi:hypothetical protein